MMSALNERLSIPSAALTLYDNELAEKGRGQRSLFVRDCEQSCWMPLMSFEKAAGGLSWLLRLTLRRLLASGDESLRH